MVAPRITARLLTAGLLTVVVSCSDPTTPDEARPANAALAITVTSQVQIRSFQVNAKALLIDGPAATATIGISNSGLAIPSGVSIQAVITQPHASREAANVALACSGLSAPTAGQLPAGKCVASFSVTASATAPGTGTLLPGSATMVVRVIRSGGRAAATELAGASFAVTLAAPTANTAPRITSVSLQSNILVIGGANVEYTVALQNPGPPLADVLLQGEIEQDQGGVTVVKGAGGTLVPCGAGLGVLPTTGTSTCSFDFTVAASSSTSGGSLIPGPARFVLHLYQAVPGAAPIELDKRIINVTLVPLTPSIVSVTPASSFVVIDNTDASTPVTITLSNPGLALSTVIVQGEIRQGTALRGAGGSNVTCAAPIGTLPNGTCVMTSIHITANNAAGGPGTLVPGSATYVVTLYHFDGVNVTTLDSKTIPITLVANAPSVVGASLPTSNP